MGHSLSQSSEFVWGSLVSEVALGNIYFFVDRDFPIFVWLPSCPLLWSCVRDEVEAWIISNASFLAKKVGKGRIGNTVSLLVGCTN